ncbi:MAG: MotA/TolQ/ExbB proton channel family protein [Planctomycetaceae bacterium]|jgi:biopolymer transport protein ExbB/TolQ|nr:MotA/TolQ/ExbB proton channel family protein [Planctomycetaceae bacterium]
MKKSDHDYKLFWHKSDIEQRFGFRGARFTNVNPRFGFLVAFILTSCFFAALFLLPENYVGDICTKRGIAPYPTVFFGVWTLVILSVKWLKLREQKKALKISVLPGIHDFVISRNTADSVLQVIHSIAPEPHAYLLYHRIISTLSNLKNLGRVSDVDDILRSHAERDENSLETSYTLVNGFLWAIPVFGFVGTVIGLSQAIGSFGSVLTSTSELEAIAESLRHVTAGLMTAFDTTLLALVVALFLYLSATALRKSEEEFLDDCAEYCNRHIVQHLRMSLFEEEKE